MMTKGPAAKIAEILDVPFPRPRHRESLDIDKIEDPKGDRVKVTMNGKFLPYKKW